MGADWAHTTYLIADRLGAHLPGPDVLTPSGGSFSPSDPPATRCTRAEQPHSVATNRRAGCRRSIPSDTEALGNILLVGADSGLVRAGIRNKRTFWTSSAAAVVALIANVLVNVSSSDVPMWVRATLAVPAVALVVFSVWLQLWRPAVSTVALRRVSAVSLGPDSMRVVGVTTGGAVIAATYQGHGTWTNWSNLRAEGTTSDVAVILPRREVVEYYAVDADGVLRMKSEDRGRQSSWRVVQPRQENGRLLRIAAMSMRMLGEHRELFGVTDNGHGVHMWRTNDDDWSGWHEMWHSDSVDVAADSPEDELIESFLVDRDGDIWRRTYKQGWSEWERWGRPGTAVVAVSSYRQTSGRQEIFAVTADGDIVHRWNGNPWSEWGKMAGQERLIDVAGATTSGDRPQCLAVDVHGALWHRLFDGRWSQWQRVPSQLVDA
jgi:hypothetical protein